MSIGRVSASSSRNAVKCKKLMNQPEQPELYDQAYDVTLGRRHSAPIMHAKSSLYPSSSMLIVEECKNENECGDYDSYVMFDDGLEPRLNSSTTVIDPSILTTSDYGQSIAGGSSFQLGFDDRNAEHDNLTISTEGVAMTGRELKDCANEKHLKSSFEMLTVDDGSHALRASLTQ